eukprot:scaffold172_cov341-Pavlova_lutheri.AAC.17
MVSSTWSVLSCTCPSPLVASFGSSSRICRNWEAFMATCAAIFCAPASPRACMRPAWHRCASKQASQHVCSFVSSSTSLRCSADAAFRADSCARSCRLVPFSPLLHAAKASPRVGGSSAIARRSAASVAIQSDGMAIAHPTTSTCTLEDLRAWLPSPLARTPPRASTHPQGKGNGNSHTDQGEDKERLPSNQTARKGKLEDKGTHTYPRTSSNGSRPPR